MNAPEPGVQRYGPADTDAPTKGRRSAPLWPCAVATLALAAAAGVAAVTFTLTRPDDDHQGWATLGAVLLASLTGTVTFAAGYVTGLVLAAKRLFPPGARALPVVIALGLPVLFAAATAAAIAATPDDLWLPVQAVAVLAMLGAGPAAFGWAGTRAGRRGLLVGTLTVIAVVGAGTAGGTVAHRAAEARAVAALPLVLFGGDTAEAPFAGWERDRFTSTWISSGTHAFAGGDETRLKYLTPQGVVIISMHTRVPACARTSMYDCRRGEDRDGREVRHYTPIVVRGAYPRTGPVDVRVYPDGSAVAVRAPAYRPSTLMARNTPSSLDVLSALERVDRRTFEHATGAPLRQR